ncbi:MAG TPA: BBP7 family outer membrane beta-barrel protein [Lacipirellulaceae bacterium]|nr:BBP7 family outer membrane beta-barrel protein [Lacipirellulaceae bacterium]
MNKLLALLLTPLLIAIASGASAQELLSPPLGAGDLPPTVDLMGETVDDAELVDPARRGTAQGLYDEHCLDAMSGEAHCPSLFESSGTWLRRGFWYAEGDYLLMNKSWDRKGLPFAFEGGVSSSPGQQFGVPGFGPVLAINSLTIDGSKPGADGLLRVTLGRFLFRDENKRDHNAEISYYGGGQWKQSSRIDAAPLGGIQGNDLIHRVNPSFDGASSMGFAYDTGYDSVEANYTVRSRMGRDQMVLHPNGQWIRTANKSQTYAFLAGLRYVNLTELLTIDAERNPTNPASEGGNYFVSTDNDMFGGQLGFSVTHETARWSIGMTAKGGSFWNRMNLDSRFTAGPAGALSTGVTDSTEDNLSFVVEFQVLGKWHLRPNLSLRAGFEILFIDSVALAPHQVNFVPGGYAPIADDGDIFAIGSSFGIEAYR